MEDQEQPFAAFVLEILVHQSPELAEWWAECAEAVAADSGEPNSDGDASEARDGTEGLVRTLIAAAVDDVPGHEPLMQAGVVMGVEAHRRNVPLHLMLKEVDLLGALVLGAAESVAIDYPASTAGHEGLAVARRISEATSQLRLAAATGYTQAIEDELRERYRVIRHDLRNPLGTIKAAVALLTDESAPAEMRESWRVRAMVVRNTSSLDQLIGEALSDAAARLRAFDMSREMPTDVSADPSADPSADSPIEAAASGREQRDDVTREDQRPDLESGAF